MSSVTGGTSEQSLYSSTTTKPTYLSSGYRDLSPVGAPPPSATPVATPVAPLATLQGYKDGKIMHTLKDMSNSTVAENVISHAAGIGAMAVENFAENYNPDYLPAGNFIEDAVLLVPRTITGTIGDAASELGEFGVDVMYEGVNAVTQSTWDLSPKQSIDRLKGYATDGLDLLGKGFDSFVTKPLNYILDKAEPIWDYVEPIWDSVEPIMDIPVKLITDSVKPAWDLVKNGASLTLSGIDTVSTVTGNLWNDLKTSPIGEIMSDTWEGFKANVYDPGK